MFFPLNLCHWSQIWHQKYWQNKIVNFKNSDFENFWGPEVSGSNLYQKVLAWNRPIGIYLHCVRTLLWFLLTMSTLIKTTISRVKRYDKYLSFNSSDSISLWASTCPLTGFFWLSSHVIYLKLTRVLSYSVFFPKQNFLTTESWTFCKMNHNIDQNFSFFRLASAKDFFLYNCKFYHSKIARNVYILLLSN